MNNMDPEQTHESAQQDQEEARSTSYDLLNYRLQEQLAQEELATAYLASHLTLNRPVQVHILRRTDWVSVSRFQLAARLAAHLSHPNLLPVIDAGHDEYFGDYIVTPLIESRILSDVLTEYGSLEPVQALRIATQMAAVLDYIHGQQIIHRDVQPANILLTTEGMAYLANLSLAASPDTPDLSSVDEADYLTPYSAPEQRLDQSEAAPTLDIYSLGAVVYHMLSGEIPPAPGTEMTTLTRYDATLQEADSIVQRMMMVQPTMRYQSAGEAVAALRRALRVHIDLSTEHMEESHWEPSAEWLENPIETVMGSLLDEDFLHRSHARTDTLHRPDSLRRLLNRWSRGGWFRRSALGQLIQIQQIVSYNIYFYTLHTYHESRIPLHPRRTPQKGDERSDVLPIIPLWDVSVPEVPPFTEVPSQEVTIPNSQRVITCPECSGVGKVLCDKCKGKGEIEKHKKIKKPDGTTTTETTREVCPTCRGYRQRPCPICEEKGNLVEVQIFQWSRAAYAWKNTDDLEGLPKRMLHKKLEPVYSAPITMYDDRWYSVAPLAELLRETVVGAGNDTRILTAELHIKGVPITEVDYQLQEDAPSSRLYIVGFDQDIVGGWALLNPERLILVGVVVILVLVIVGVVVAVL